MKSTFIATLLVSAASVSFAAAQTATSNQDAATYKSVTQKVAADYKVATAQCSSMAGNAKAICKEEAKAARAHAKANAIAQYNNTPKSYAKALTAAANADYSLAKVKCADMSGADKEGCINNAHSVHVAAVADAKAGRGTMASNANNATDGARGTMGAADRSGSTATVIENNRAGAQTGVDSSRNAGTQGRAGEGMDNRSGVAGQRTGAVVADSVITTKVKADIFKEPELKSMAIHVETEKGVVMLSGFVDSKAHADRAVQLAKEVEGVANVKSAIKVK